MPIMKKRPMDFTGRRTLNAHEAARYIEISYTTFIGVVEAGEIPYRKLGRRYLFTPKELDRWLSGAATATQTAQDQKGGDNDDA